jgi:hypothetical protein
MNLYLVRNGDKTRVFSPGGEELFPDLEMAIKIEKPESKKVGIEEDSCTVTLTFSDVGLGYPKK